MAEQQATRPRAAAPKSATRSGVPPAVRDAAAETAVDLLRGRAVDAAFGEQPSYLKAAFLNPYNLSLLGGAAAVRLFTNKTIIYSTKKYLSHHFMYLIL